MFSSLLHDSDQEMASQALKRVFFLAKFPGANELSYVFTVLSVYGGDLSLNPNLGFAW